MQGSKGMRRDPGLPCFVEKSEVPIESSGGCGQDRVHEIHQSEPRLSSLLLLGGGSSCTSRKATATSAVPLQMASRLLGNSVGSVAMAPE